MIKRWILVVAIWVKELTKSGIHRHLWRIHESRNWLNGGSKGGIHLRTHMRICPFFGLLSTEPVQRILAHLGMPTDPPLLTRARDPTDDLEDDEAVAQLSLDLA